MSLNSLMKDDLKKKTIKDIKLEYESLFSTVVTQTDTHGDTFS